MMPPEFEISDKYRSIYNYSQSSEWRELCAIDKASNIVQVCRDIPHDSVLEVGSGDGAVLNQLSLQNFGQKLAALEITESAVSIIRSRNIENLENVEMYDGIKIPYPKKRFDLAILCHVVEHLEFPRQLLYEAKRVAKYVFVEVPLEDNVRLNRDYTFSSVGHINFYNPKTIRRLLQTCELDVIKHEITNPSYDVYRFQYSRNAFLRYLPKALSLWAAPLLAPYYFTYHCSLLCKS